MRTVATDFYEESRYTLSNLFLASGNTIGACASGL